MQQPITVITFRGVSPESAGTANIGDVTLRVTGDDDEVVDIVFPGGASPEVFAAIRAKATELEALLNDVTEA